MCELHRVGQRSHLEVELRRLGFTLGLNLKHETLFLFKLLDSYLMQIRCFFFFLYKTAQSLQVKAIFRTAEQVFMNVAEHFISLLIPQCHSLSNTSVARLQLTNQSQ